MKTIFRQRLLKMRQEKKKRSMSEKEAVFMGQAAEVIVEQLVLALVGLSAGAAVAGGLFSFIVELGVIADFADRTHTGDKLLFYETCVALGGIIGNIVFLFYSFAPNAVSFASASFASGAVQVLFGIFAGIFVGCWSMALAEILNVFPIFMRRARIVRYASVFVIGAAIGKGLGAGLFFLKGW